MDNWQLWLWLALAGAAGTLSRYLLGGACHQMFGEAFPWGTFIINVLGSFAFGIVWALSAERNVLGPEIRTVVLIGFMGAFTTFSTLMFDSGQMLRDGQLLLCGANLLGQNALGLLGFFGGLRLGQSI